MSYFNLAVSLARAEAAHVTQKRKPQNTCGCSAYKFPHRFGGGDCQGQSQITHGKSQREIDLADFDRTEAMAINQSR